jgi:outer membrane protein W
MSAKQHFFLYFFLLIAVPTFTQITKGSKTISYANLGYRLNSQSSLSGTNINNEYTDYSIGLYVSGLSYMITNHLQVGLGFGLGYSKNNYSTDFNGNPIESSLNSYSLMPDLTYYFTKDNKGFYANIGGEYSSLFFKTKNKTLPNQEVSESRENFNVRIGLGYVKPINENVYLNYLVGFERSNIGNLFNNTIGVSVGLRNFVPSILGDKTEDTPQYLESGRSIIDGYLNAQHVDFDNGLISFGGSFSRLKFKNNHFAFGYYGGFYINILPQKDDQYYVNGGTKARYYISISKRWFIYPELGLGLDLNKSNGNIRVSFVLNKRVGFNYFLTKNVALDASISFEFYSDKPDDLQRNSSTSYLNSNINFGVTYFIDKLF